MQGDLKMINELVKLSNHLDKLGLVKEANFLDEVTKRLSLNKTAQDANLEGRIAALEKDVADLKNLRPLLPHINGLRNLVREGNYHSTVDLMGVGSPEKREQRQENRDRRRQ